MKNKKLYNLYLLCLSLLALITFIVPLQKINPASTSPVGIMVGYYITGGIMCLALVLIIALTIIAMFHDDYENVKFSKALATIAFLMLFVNMLIFGASINQAFSWGYTLLAVEVFALFSFNQIVRAVTAFCGVGKYFTKLFPNAKRKEKPKVIKAEKPAKKEKPKKNVTIIKSSKGGSKPEVFDNKLNSDDKKADETTAVEKE